MSEAGPAGSRPEDIGKVTFEQAEAISSSMPEATSFHSEFGDTKAERLIALKEIVISSSVTNKDNLGGPHAKYNDHLDGKNTDLLLGIPDFDTQSSKYKKDGQLVAPVVAFNSLDKYAHDLLKGRRPKTEQAKKIGFEREGGKKDGNIISKWGEPVDVITYEFSAFGIDSRTSGAPPLGGKILMKPEDASRFRKEMQEHPELLFELMEAANNGPVRGEGGVVADKAVLGNGITIVANERYGGDIKADTPTKPFPPDYKPFAESGSQPSPEPASPTPDTATPTPDSTAEAEKSTRELMQEMMQKYNAAQAEFSSLMSMRADMSEDEWQKKPEAGRLNELSGQLWNVNEVIEARFGSIKQGLFYNTFEDFTSADQPNLELDAKKLDIFVLAKEYFSGRAIDVSLGNFYDETRPLSKLAVPGNSRSEFVRKFKEGGIGDPENKDIKEALANFDQNETASSVEDLIVWGEQEKPPYEGLLFDNVRELRLAVGEDVLSEEQARVFVDKGIHLMDEKAIWDTFKEKGVAIPQIRTMVNGIRHYRQEDGFAFGLSDEVLGRFPVKQTRNLDGVDLADLDKVSVLAKGDKPKIGKSLRREIDNQIDQKIRSDKERRHVDHLESFRDMSTKLTAAEDRIKGLQELCNTIANAEEWNKMPESKELVDLNRVYGEIGGKANELIMARYGFADNGLYGQMYDNPGNDATRAALIAKRSELFGLAKDYFGRNQELDDRLDVWYSSTQQINQRAGLMPKLTLEQFKDKFKNAGRDMSGKDITALMVEWDEAEQTDFNISLRELAAEAEADGGNEWSLKKLLPSSVLVWATTLQHKREEVARTRSATPHERKTLRETADDITNWWNNIKKTNRQAQPFQGRDIKEWGAIGARVATDFVPEVGYLMLGANAVGIFARERQTKKRINEEHSGESALRRWAIYIEQTTLGKIADFNKDSKLTAGQRASAVAFGAGFSALGVLASEGLTNVVRVPGVRGAARLALMRVATQVLLPRAADLVAARITRKNENEEARREWADVALSTTSMTNTLLTTAMTGLVLHNQGETLLGSLKPDESVVNAASNTIDKGADALRGIGEIIESIDIPGQHEQFFQDTKENFQNSGWANELNRVGEKIDNAVKNIDLNELRSDAGEALHNLGDKLESNTQVDQNEHLPSAPSEGVQEPVGYENQSQPETTHDSGGGHLAAMAPIELNNPNLDVTGVHHFSDGSQINIEDGKITDAILANGQHLNLDPNTVSGQANLELLNMHIDDKGGAWSPEVVAKAEYLAELNHKLDLKNLDDIEHPEMPAPQIELGKPETEISVNGGSYWLDENNQVVSVHSDKYGWLQFDPNAAEGGEAWNQFQLANTHQQLGDLQNYSVDQLVNEAHLAASGKVDIYDPKAMEGVIQESQDRIDSQTRHEPYTTENTTHGAEYDSDSDGKPDSWWMKDADGKDVAGHLEDGRTLHLDADYGGLQGQFQGLLHEANPNLSPDRVAHIADVVANKHDLSVDNVNDVLGNKDVLLTVYHEMVGYSVQDYLVDKFGLSPVVAKDLAFNKLNFSFFEVGDAPILSSNPGVDILERASVRISIDGENYPYMDNHLENWLIENGYIKK